MKIIKVQQSKENHKTFLPVLVINRSTSWNYVTRATCNGLCLYTFYFNVINQCYTDKSTAHSTLSPSKSNDTPDNNLACVVPSKIRPGLGLRN